jgi:hypothetical protein
MQMHGMALVVLPAVSFQRVLHVLVEGSPADRDELVISVYPLFPQSALVRAEVRCRRIGAGTMALRFLKVVTKHLTHGTRSKSG